MTIDAAATEWSVSSIPSLTHSARMGWASARPTARTVRTPGSLPPRACPRRAGVAAATSPSSGQAAAAAAAAAAQRGRQRQLTDRHPTSARGWQRTNELVAGLATVAGLAVDGHQTCVVRFGHALVGTSRTRTIGTSRTMPRTYLLWSFLLCAAAPWAAGHLVVGTAAPMSWMSSPKPPLLRQCSALDGPVARLRGGCASGLSGYIDNAKTWNPILLALIGTTFGWFMTALGSAMVVVHGLGLSEVAYRKARLTRPSPRRPRRPTPPPAATTP